MRLVGLSTGHVNKYLLFTTIVSERPTTEEAAKIILASSTADERRSRLPPEAVDVFMDSHMFHTYFEPLNFLEVWVKSVR